MELPIFKVDAFTNRLFHGNQAAVCPLPMTGGEGGWPLTDSQLLNIAAENNLAETAFCMKRDAESGVPSYNLRWFTPELEMDLCGHATLATAHVLFHHYEQGASTIVFISELSGDLLVTRVGESMYEMILPARPPEQLSSGMPDNVARALSIQPKEVLKSRDYVLVYESSKMVRSLAVDSTILARVNDLNTGGIIVTAPNDCEEEDADVDFVSRFFGPGASVFEDPVTGSAHCSLVPYWSARLGKKTLLAKQVSSRTGILRCKDLGDKVSVAGEVVTYLQGSICLC